MELDFSEEEPTVLEYARLHGLCRDYSLEQPSIDSIPAPSDDDVEACLKDLTDTCLPNSIDSLTKERLTLSKDGALLLKEVLLVQEPLNLDAALEETWKRGSRLKLELPLLRTDNEIDVQEFGNTDVPSFTSLRIPLESVNEEDDEGLQWPSKYSEYPEIYGKQVRSEKLTVSKEGFLFLQDTARDKWNPAVSDEILKGGTKAVKNPVTRALTPPLLPLSPPLSSYVPSSPGNRLELLSEDSNSTAAELRVIDQQIMKDDALIPPLRTDGSDDSMLLDGFESPGDVIDKPSSLPRKRKARDLKIEGPLTPPIFSDSPMKKLKSVSFKEMISENIPDPPSTFESGDDILENDESIAIFYKEVAPIAEDVNREVENEKLSEIDTTARVDVPTVDFTLPVAPWEQFARTANGKLAKGETQLDAQMRFLHHLKRQELKTASSWHGISKLDRDLSWAVFPIEMASVRLEEHLHGEEVLNKLLTELTMGDIATSSTDIWKRDRLRILEYGEDNDEDELELADIQPSTLDSMIRKRNRELEEDEGDATSHHKKLERTERRPKQQLRGEFPTDSGQTSVGQLTLREKRAPALKKTEDNSLMFGGKFSASTALHKFMELRGKPAVSDNNLDGAPSTQALPPATAEGKARQDPFPSKSLDLAKVPEITSKNPAPTLPKLPSIPANLPPCSFIISSTLLRQRSLTKEVENIYPNAVFVERDFDLSHSPADEADLLLSPSTGLIFTTLQQIKQRALPGLPDKSPIKDRIIALQARYERLIVLISEGLGRKAEESGSSRPVDSRDQEALTEFDGFTSNLEAEIINTYVPGGEMALSRTIVGKMAEYGLPHGSRDIGDLKLLQDETTWEVFLRRAGLNPFAAQIILVTFKDPYDMPLSSSSPESSDVPEKIINIFGLPAFLLLSAEERIARFQVLLGGSRILSRVNALLDRKWPSAANGFAL